MPWLLVAYIRFDATFLSVGYLGKAVNNLTEAAKTFEQRVNNSKTAK